MTDTANPGLDERVAKLHDRLNEPMPETWKPAAAGEQIVGRFVRLDRGVTAFGDSWIVVLESLNRPGSFASIWLFHTALINQFGKARPQPGELVLVRYEGKRQAKGGGSEYHDWKVVTEHAGAVGGFGWDDITAPSQPAPTVPLPAATAGSPGSEFWPAAPAAPAAPADTVDPDDIPF